MPSRYAYTHTIETDATRESIWELYADPDTWPLWDAGVARVTRDGPFASGTSGTMYLRGQDPLRYHLASVEPHREFTDETPVGDIVVRVSHRLEPRPGGRVAVTYTVAIDGPVAAGNQIGPLITEDFPATMASLVALAKERCS